MFMSFATSEPMFEYLGLRKIPGLPSKKLSIIRRLIQQGEGPQGPLSLRLRPDRFPDIQ